jgi:tetratricopeptide (TPR) repeat protein
MQQGQYKKTVSLLLRSIELLKDDKDKAVSWNRLANVYRYLNDYDNAIAAYQMADSLAPAGTVSKNRDLDCLPEQSPASDDVEMQIVDDVPSQCMVDEGLQAVVVEKIAEPENTSDAAATDRIILEAPAWIFNPEQNQANMKTDEKALDFHPIGNDPKVMKGASMTNITSSDASQVQSEAAAPDQTSIREAVENKTESMDAFKWNERGNVFFSQGEFDEAINAYNKASQLDPSFGMPYSNLALTYLTQGHYAEAILLYQRSIELLTSDKDRALSWNGLGNAFRCINDYANAVAAYQKAAELDPETAGMRDGANSIQTGQSPRNAKAWGDLGELFLKMGSFDEAIEAFQKAIELEPGNGGSYGNLAYAFVSLGNYTEAVPLFQKSIDLLDDDKEKAAAWNRLGNVYRKLNDYDNAIKAYQKAVVLADEGVNLLTRTRFSLLSNLTVNQ